MCWKFPEVFLKPWAFWTSAETLVKDSAPIGDAETALLGGAKKCRARKKAKQPMPYL